MLYEWKNEHLVIAACGFPGQQFSSFFLKQQRLGQGRKDTMTESWRVTIHTRNRIQEYLRVRPVVDLVCLYLERDVAFECLDTLVTAVLNTKPFIVDLDKFGRKLQNRLCVAHYLTQLYCGYFNVPMPMKGRIKGLNRK